MRCPKCGKAIISRYAYCGFCGTKIGTNEDEAPSVKEEIPEIDNDKTIIVGHSNSEDSYFAQDEAPFEQEDVQTDDETLEELDEIIAGESLDDSEITYEDSSIVEEMSDEELDRYEASYNESLEETPSSDEIDEPDETTYEEAEYYDDNASTDFVDGDSIPDDEEDIEPEEESEDNLASTEETPVEVDNTSDSNEESSDDSENLVEDSKNEEQAPIVAPLVEEPKKAAAPKNPKLFNMLVIILMFAALIISCISFGINNIISELIDHVKEVENYTTEEYKHYADYLYYVVIFTPYILRISMALIGFIKAIYILLKPKGKDNSNKIIYILSMAVVFSFISSIIMYNIFAHSVSSSEVALDFKLNVVSLGIVCVASIIGMIKNTYIVDEDRSAVVVKYIIDMLAAGSLIALLMLLSTKLMTINHALNLRILDIYPTVYDAIPNSAEASKMARAMLSSFAYEAFAYVFIICTGLQLVKKLSYKTKNGKSALALIVLFVLTVIFYFIAIGQITHSLGIPNIVPRDKMLYVIVLTGLGLVLEIIRTIADDIGEHKKLDFVIKRMLVVLMMAGSILLGVVYIIPNIPNLIPKHINSDKCMKIIMTIFIIIGLYGVFKSYFKEDINDAFSGGARGLSLSFSACLVEGLYQLTLFHKIKGEPKYEFSIPTAYIICISSCMVIFLIAMLYNVIHRSENDGKKKLVVICSSVKVILNIAAIAAVFMFLGRYEGRIFTPRYNAEVLKYECFSIYVQEIIAIFLILSLSTNIVRAIVGYKLYDDAQNYIVSIILVFVYVAVILYELAAEGRVNNLEDVKLMVKVFKIGIIADFAVLLLLIILTPIFNALYKSDDDIIDLH